MAKYLDFYLADNGRMDYSRDISLVQYSTDYIIRLYTRIPYDNVTMNITLPDNIHTYKKTLTRTNSIGEYFVYVYTLQRDITGIVIPGDKAILKIGFYLYPDRTNTEKVDTVSTCYLPILATTQPEDYDGSMTSSYYDEISAELNDVKGQLDNLEIGIVDTSKNYDITEGNIKDKFTLNDAEIENLKTRVALILQILGSTGIEGDESVVETLSTIQSQVNTLQKNTADIQHLAVENNKNISIHNVNIRDNTDNISKILNEVLPVLQAGIKYELVNALPTNPKPGVVYLVSSKSPSGKNVYAEYMYINDSWELIGSAEASVDLTKYFTKDEIVSLLNTDYYNISQIQSKFYTKSLADDTFTKKTDIIDITDNLDNIGDVLSRIPAEYATKDEMNEKATKSNTLSGYGITDAYTKTQVDNKVSASVKTAKDELQRQITGNDTDISNIQADIKNNVKPDIETAQQTADEALHIAQSKNLVLVFDTKDKMISFLRTKDTQYLSNTININLITIGSEILIKDNNVADYWISSVFTYPATYTTKFGDTFTNVYYGVEEAESKTDLSNYATVQKLNESNSRITILETRAKNLEDTREYVSNKLQQGIETNPVITKSTVLDRQYPSSKAVLTYVESVDAKREEWIDENYYTKTVSENYFRLDPSKTNKDKFVEEINRINKKDSDQDGDIDTLEKGLASEINRAGDEEKRLERRINDNLKEINNTKSALAAEITNRTNSDAQTLTDAKAYTDQEANKFKDGTYPVQSTRAVADYRDETKYIRLTTDSEVKDFIITDVDLQYFQQIYVDIVPNEYN